MAAYITKTLCKIIVASTASKEIRVKEMVLLIEKIRIKNKFNNSRQQKIPRRNN